MNLDLLEKLSQITSEETVLLEGNDQINRSIYMSNRSDMIDSGRFVDINKQVQLRPHTRFVHFPRHTHNYVEIVYMCRGETTHFINDEKVVLKQGELLFIPQGAVQEILPASQEDIAVNFIVLPSFFDVSLKMIGEEENLIRQFLISAIRGHQVENIYLHFKVAEIIAIQNLIENLIISFYESGMNKRSVNQTTMGF